MSDLNAAGEQSMDEILASIRRMIATDPAKTEPTKPLPVRLTAENAAHVAPARTEATPAESLGGSKTADDADLDDLVDNHTVAPVTTAAFSAMSQRLADALAAAAPKPVTPSAPAAAAPVVTAPEVATLATNVPPDDLDEVLNGIEALPIATADAPKAAVAAPVVASVAPPVSIPVPPIGGLTFLKPLLDRTIPLAAAPVPVTPMPEVQLDPAPTPVQALAQAPAPDLAPVLASTPAPALANQTPLFNLGEVRPSLTVHGVPTLEPIETPEAPALPEASEPADPMMAVMSALAALAPGIAVAAQGAPDSTTTAALPISDDAIAKLLQPMLRQWLDDNMPRIVEKALRNGLDGGAKTE